MQLHVKVYINDHLNNKSKEILSNVGIENNINMYPFNCIT